MPELTGRRLAVVFGLGLLVGIVAVVAAVMLLAHSGAGGGCAIWSYSGPDPALRQAAAAHPSTCR